MSCLLAEDPAASGRLKPDQVDLCSFDGWIWLEPRARG